MRAGLRPPPCPHPRRTSCGRARNRRAGPATHASARVELRPKARTKQRQEPDTGSPALSANTLWYKDAGFYELHVKAFQDSSQDGVGDFGGLIQRLDYVAGLGVDVIWLLPFYPSPLRDDGYDIADYYGIHPNYGTIDDVQRFLDEAHKRGLKVIADLVLNHTSSDHPWFQRARRAPRGSPERDFYVWSDDDTL